MAPGWMGDYCERHVCAMTGTIYPCKNGGACVPSEGSHLGYKCRCPNGIDEDVESCDIGGMGTVDHDLLGTMAEFGRSGKETTPDKLLREMEDAIEKIEEMIDSSVPTCKLLNLAAGMDYTVDQLLKTSKTCRGVENWVHVERFGSFYYGFPQKQATYAEAFDLCRKIGADIIPIGNYEEHFMLSKMATHDSFWIGLDSRNVTHTHARFNNKCKIHSPIDFGIKMPKGGSKQQHCYSINGLDKNVVSISSCKETHMVMCKKVYDPIKSCEDGAEIARCPPANVLTDGRVGTNATLDKTFMNIPERIIDSGYSTFTVVIESGQKEGNMDKEAVVYSGITGNWVRCTSIEKTELSEEFECRNFGSLKFGGKRVVGEIKVLGCDREGTQPFEVPDIGDVNWDE